MTDDVLDKFGNDIEEGDDVLATLDGGNTFVHGIVTGFDTDEGNFIDEMTDDEFESLVGEPYEYFCEVTFSNDTKFYFAAVDIERLSRDRKKREQRLMLLKLEGAIINDGFEE